MMISKRMADVLNQQVTKEFYSYWIYLAMSYAFQVMDLKVFAQWFDAQAAEEQVHANKMAQYLVDQGATLQLGSLDKPRADFKSAEEIVAAGLEHEKLVTSWIHDLVAIAEEEKDYATRSFLQWFVDEQVEEVATAAELLSLVKMAGSPDQLLLLENRIMSLRGGEN